MKIRNYLPQDLEAITKTIDVFKHENLTRKLFFPKQYVDINNYKKNYLGKTDVIIVEERGTISGFSVAHPLPRPEHNTYWLEIIYVVPNQRGKDLAKGMMQKFLDTAYEKGYKKAQSKVNKENIESIELHKRLGFYNELLSDDRFYLMIKKIK